MIDRPIVPGDLLAFDWTEHPVDTVHALVIGVSPTPPGDEWDDRESARATRLTQRVGGPTIEVDSRVIKEFWRRALEGARP